MVRPADFRERHHRTRSARLDRPGALAAAVKLTVEADENLTVGSAVGCRLRA